MSKFKIGDIVRANKKNGWIGKVVETKGAGYFAAETIAPDSEKGTVFGCSCWSLEEKYFDLVQNQIQKHIVNKNTAVVILQDGRKGVAKCSPDDKFNIAFGTALAVARAYGDKETEAKLLAEPSEPVKEEPKFKVGELVKIRQWDDMAKEFGVRENGSIDGDCYFTSAMKPLCGKYAEITRLHIDKRVNLRFFNCDSLKTGWIYSIDMIEKV